MPKKRVSRNTRKISARKKESKKNSVPNLLSRYLILVLVAVSGLWVFYKIFTPLTTYPVNFILSLFYNTYLESGTKIMANGIDIDLIKACIAGSAYYLLLIFNLSTPGIKIAKRIGAIIFSFAAFLALNIIRIVVLSALAVSGSSYFDVTHTLFWYGLSTIIVVGIWFIEVKLFEIKEIPLYSDLKFLHGMSHLKK